MIQQYRISEKALNDLEKIWLYTYKKWSKELADRYHNLIIDEIEFMVNNYKLSGKIDYVREGYRITKVKSYLIFAKKSLDDIIEIVRILHQNMDIENRLKE